MKVFCKTYTLFCFWISSGKLSAGCPRKTCAAFKLLSTSPWELFEENVLEKFWHLLWTFIWIISGNWAGRVRRRVKTAFFVSINSFWRKNWLGKQMKFFIIFRKWAGSFQLLVEFFDGDVRTAFYVSEKKNILTKNSFISDFFFIFEHWVIFWSILAKKVAELSKLDSQFHWKLSGESFLQNLHTVLFLNIEWKTFGWLSEKNLRGFQAAFYLSMGTFWRKCFGKVFADLWTFFLINSGNWAGKVWPVSQNCILRIYRIILRKNWFGKEMKLFIIFRQWAWSFRLLGEFFDGNVRTAFYVSKRTFQRRTVLFLFFFHFWTLSDFFWPILAKEVAELSKLASQFQWRLSRESFLQNLQIVFFLNFERKVFGWLSGKSQWGFQAALYFSMGTIWRKFFWKVFASSVDFFSDHFR